MLPQVKRVDSFMHRAGAEKEDVEIRAGVEKFFFIIPAPLIPEDFRREKNAE